MAYTDIDRVNGRTIRKLHSPSKDRVFGFLSGIKDEAGNLSDIQKHENLTEARNACGFQVKPLDVKHMKLKKSAYPQNRPGYDPHNVR